MTPSRSKSCRPSLWILIQKSKSLNHIRPLLTASFQRRRGCRCIDGCVVLVPTPVLATVLMMRTMRRCCCCSSCFSLSVVDLLPSRLRASTEYGFFLKFSLRENNKYRIRQELYRKAYDRLREKLKVFLEASGVHGDELEHQVTNHEFRDEQVMAELDGIDVPPGFANHQWLKFKSYMKSEKAKKLSEKGKRARATQSHIHITGTKSYAQVEDEHAAAKSEIVRCKVAGTCNNTAKLESHVWNQLMGDDRLGRARGYGTGVTKSSVTSFRAKLRRMRSESENFNTNESKMTDLRLLISKQQQQLVEQEKSMTEYMVKTNEIISKLKDEVLLYRTAFGGSSDYFLTSNMQETRAISKLNNQGEI